MTKNNILELPHSKESEMMVLGCMLTSKEHFKYAAQDLDQSDFYHIENKTLFGVLKKLSKEKDGTDVHLVCEALKAQDKLNTVGGVAYVITLAQFAGTCAYLEDYCKTVKEKAHLRGILNLATGIIKDLSSFESPQKVSDYLKNALQNYESQYSQNDKATIGQILSGQKSRVDSTPLMNRIHERMEYFKANGKPFLTGFPTGFTDIDKQVTLLEDTSLIVIAGRPAMGKTAFALNILSNIAFDQGLPVGFISLEMGADQLTERLLSTRARVNGEKIRRGLITEEEFQRLLQEEDRLKNSSFFIHDQSISTVSQVASRARKLKEENDIKILAIDYLQLLGTDTGNDSRQYEVAEVSRTLKQLARELKIPIIAVSQLSRKVEERKDKKPMLSDLRDSGQIEQDADSVIAVYRRSYYDPIDYPNTADILVLKNRHGSTAEARLNFQADCGAFGNLVSLNPPSTYQVQRENAQSQKTVHRY